MCGRLACWCSVRYKYESSTVHGQHRPGCDRLIPFLAANIEHHAREIIRSFHENAATSLRHTCIFTKFTGEAFDPLHLSGHMGSKTAIRPKSTATEMMKPAMASCKDIAKEHTQNGASIVEVLKLHKIHGACCTTKAELTLAGVHTLLDSFEPIHDVLLCQGEDVDPSAVAEFVHTVVAYREKLATAAAVSHCALALPKLNQKMEKQCKVLVRSYSLAKNLCLRR
uniref:Uncharacterized protein n=1 Tax=Oryza glumipatula TaxID=40148 RepID=A0A0D9YBJ6_9ORYZ